MQRRRSDGPADEDGREQSCADGIPWLHDWLQSEVSGPPNTGHGRAALGSASARDGLLRTSCGLAQSSYRAANPLSPQRAARVVFVNGAELTVEQARELVKVLNAGCDMLASA